jgi:hypothetical protein
MGQRLLPGHHPRRGALRGASPFWESYLSAAGLEKEVAMPTQVHFIGGEGHFTLEEDFDKVNSQLHASDAGQFIRLVGDGRSRVTIYKSGIKYIEEASDGAPLVASA